MPDEVSGQETADLRFVISVRDTTHIEAVLRNLRRLQSVMKADRVTSGSARDSHPSNNR
jgi:GTP pyrophosphokinase